MSFYNELNYWNFRQILDEKKIKYSHFNHSDEGRHIISITLQKKIYIPSEITIMENKFFVTQSNHIL